MTTDPGTGTTTTETITEFGLGTLVRYPLIRHHHVDFEIVGRHRRSTSPRTRPARRRQDKTTTTFGIGWGIGIGYWLSRHWQLSATATNPLLAFTKTSQQVTSDTETMSTSTTSVGITFAPAITFMVHLYN